MRASWKLICALTLLPLPLLAGPEEELASRIDGAIDRGLREAKLRPAPPARPEVLLRRLSLDLTGRVPTPAALSRLRGPDTNWQTIIEEQMSSPAFNERWADVLAMAWLPNRPATELARPPFEQAFVDWLRDQIAAERPLDAVARDILAAEGRPSEKPELYFTLAGPETEDLAARSATAFMGLQIQCAQCHDHPFARWKQEQFHRYAAFFAGVELEEGEEESIRVFQRPEALWEAPVDGGRERLFRPRFPVAIDAAVIDAPRASRAVAARLITSRGNPLFARNLANRLWRSLMGRGLVEPVDDLESADGPHKELLAAIAARFAQDGFRLRPLVKAIVSTRAYRRAVPQGRDAAEPGLFSGARSRPLGPWQLIRSYQVISGMEALPARRVELFEDDEGESAPIPDAVRARVEALYPGAAPALREVFYAGTPLEAFVIALDPGSGAPGPVILTLSLGGALIERRVEHSELSLPSTIRESLRLIAAEDQVISAASVESSARPAWAPIKSQATRYQLRLSRGGRSGAFLFSEDGTLLQGLRLQAEDDDEDEEDEDEAEPVERLPRALREMLRARYPNLAIGAARVRERRGLEVFEVDLGRGSSSMVLLCASNGLVLGERRSLQVDALPAPVQATLNLIAPGARVIAAEAVIERARESWRALKRPAKRYEVLTQSRSGYHRAEFVIRAGSIVRFESADLGSENDDGDDEGLAGGPRGRLLRALIARLTALRRSGPAGTGSLQEALLKLNGPFVAEASRARPGTPLDGILQRSEDPGDRLRAVYELVLGRAPSAEERRALLGDLGRGREAYEDLTWALLNSSEFLFRR